MSGEGDLCVNSLVGHTVFVLSLRTSRNGRSPDDSRKKLCWSATISRSRDFDLSLSNATSFFVHEKSCNVICCQPRPRLYLGKIITICKHDVPGERRQSLR